MRKILLTVLALSTVLFITACGSKEEKEVLNFHNDMVDEVYPLYDEFLHITDGISIMASDEEIYDVYEAELIPLADKIQSFFEEYDPETDVAREYYDLRKGEYQYLLDFIYEGQEMVGDYIAGDISDEEFDEKAEEISLYMDRHFEEYEKADARWDEIFDEYGFRELKE